MNIVGRRLYVTKRTMRSFYFPATAVRNHYNSVHALLHYGSATKNLGLWKSERVLFKRIFCDRSASLIEAGCGAGRVSIGMWRLGYRNIAAFDIAAEQIDLAKTLAFEAGAHSLVFFEADAVRLSKCKESVLPERKFDGALFMFNGLMQIPGRRARRRALLELWKACRKDAHFIFTTHDRDCPLEDGAFWEKERELWKYGNQDPRLLEFGDLIYSNSLGEIFVHVPNQSEIIEDLDSSGWKLLFHSSRSDLANEPPEVKRFSDECHFWVASRR